ncbi:putative copper resistance protein D [Blastococcus colisei]|uniref:Putative copper resistance protein D n=1 Tax=Blastococcus colisei TaxID=1564162 RepID=A0A543PIN4_9ACTN|nr:CopD family protein [Blastococcus colisei]TQN43938.1 putative copper resistance protein D [Blastococcus colisei]
MTTGRAAGATALAEAPGTAAAGTSTAAAPEDAAPLRGRVLGAVAAGIAGLVALLLLALAVGGGGQADASGLDQSGRLVDLGLPISALAARVAALGTVGTLLFAAVLLPGPGRALPAAAQRAARAASLWAAAWVGATALNALFTVSELVGVPPTSLTSSSVRIFVTDVAAGRAAVAVIAAAGFLALVARRCRGTASAALLLAVALSGLVVPAVLTGHSAAADNHLLAVTNLSVHVVSAAVWVGGLIALLVHGRGRDDLAPAAARFSAVALVCFLATGASGLLAAWLVLGGDTDALAAVTGTGYGWLLVGKAAGLAALGVFGWQHRRRTLPALRAGRRRAFRRFAALEAVVMLATIALAVALSASPPPAASSPPAVAQSVAPGAQPGPAAPEPGIEDMAGHDHGDLSVTVLIDETRFHVSAPVSPDTAVTVHNATGTEVTITAVDGSFDVVVPGGTLMTFPAPDEPGSYPFESRHSASFTGVLVVR